jgi:hypothetical protein
MSRCAMVWILAGALALPAMSAAPATATPLSGTSQIAVANEGGSPGPVILWSLVARFIGPNGSGLDPSGSTPTGTARGPEAPAKKTPGIWFGALVDDVAIRSL